VTEVLNLKSLYPTVLLGAENAEEINDTIDLNAEWNR